VAALIPLEVLFGNPDHATPLLSHDGTRLSYLAPVDGVLNVWAGAVGEPARPVTSDTTRGIRSYGWAHDNRHLFYLQDQGGDENWHLHTVDVESGADVDRTPFPGAQAQVLASSRRRPDQLLVGVNADDPRWHDVYLLDLSQGTLDKVATNPGFDQWLIDADLTIRGGIRTTPDGAHEYLIGDGDGTSWPLVLTIAPEDAALGASEVVGFDAKGDRLWLLNAVGADTKRLVGFYPATGAHQLVYADPTHDVVGVILHGESREPQVAVVERERAELVVLDPSLAGDIETLRELGGGDVHIVSRDHADQRWLICSDRDDASPAYYLYERDQRTTTFLFPARPALGAFALAKVEPFSFSTSDSLTIHGYATAPVDRAREHLPTVLYVHGGPWGVRHRWGFEPDAQWLANRGYLCLQINFRGSGGYGKAFINASAQEWAGRMHADLIEGLQWATDAGWVDPERVAIMGGSYGGYAALVGATFTPDVFRCAIDIVGPSNLITLLEGIPPYWVGLRSQLHRLLGHPEADRDFLWERSPLAKADAIRIPILIAQGANDPRVPQAESEQIVSAMKERGIAFEYLLFPDEGHGFAKPENLLRFYRAAEDFLAEHL
jgi:dipeptidyl aminopeptidase/acylaminoacyl peptidase